MIKIRLQRHGARHAPFYRMVVAPAQARRDGRFIEVLGTYDPQSSIRERELNLKMDRIEHWLEVGAQPTETAKSLIRQGRLTPEDWLKRTETKASAKSARAAKKKNPLPVAESPTAPTPEDSKETPAEEAPATETKEEAKAEEPASVVEESKEETVVEEVSPEEAPATEAKEEAKSEEPASVVEESKEETVVEDVSPEEAPATEAKEEAKSEEPAAVVEESKEETVVKEEPVSEPKEDTDKAKAEKSEES